MGDTYFKLPLPIEKTPAALPSLTASDAQRVNYFKALNVAAKQGGNEKLVLIRDVKIFGAEFGASYSIDSTNNEVKLSLFAKSTGSEVAQTLRLLQYDFVYSPLGTEKTKSGSESVSHVEVFADRRIRSQLPTSQDVEVPQALGDEALRQLVLLVPAKKK